MKLQMNDFLLCNYPAGTDAYTLNRISIFNIFIAIYLFLAVPFCIIHMVLHNYFIASVLLAGSVIICADRFFLCATKKHETAFVIAVFVAMAPLLSSYITGGIHNYGPLWFFPWRHSYF